MGEDLIRYDIVVQDALRQAVGNVLAGAARDGLPGDHHFYITFMTAAPGVKLSQKIKAQYPEEMTIVLQHQFWDLKADEEHFEVKLSFNNKTEHLVIPFSAIKSFVDPSVEFALHFGQHEGEPVIAPNTPPEDIAPEAPLAFAPVGDAGEVKQDAQDNAGKAEAAAGQQDDGEDAGQAEIVQLDAFRKKS